MSTDDRVAVIIPAYKASTTLDETLRSIRGQSHRNLDIVVVDDGSPDGGETFALAERHARSDPRVRAVRQDNGGVAAARNTGLALTDAPLVACCDADDLWAPAMVERCVAAFRQGGAGVGLVYAWFAAIDGDSRVTRLGRLTDAEGDVLEDLCLFNVVGNGSGAMMRREALAAVGGYDSSLRANKAQGSEDWKVYFGIAERARFGLVRDHLVGYRETAGNMSSEPWENLRSRDMVAAEFALRHPDLAPTIARGRTRLLRFMLSRAMRAGRHDNAARLLVTLLRHDPVGAAGHFADILADRLIRPRGQSLAPGSWARVGERFRIGEPVDGITA
jgi:glycosyltransferase involved in cell wall biosynthesis